MSKLVPIYPFNVKEASQAEYSALNKHNNLMRQERLPDDPPIPFEETVQEMKNLPAFVELNMWCAWDQAEIVGQANILLMQMEENRHLAQFDIAVRPDYRQQGLGRQFLKLVTDSAEADNRQLLLTETGDRVPAGEVFMNRLGAQKGLESHVNQLRIDELNRNLLQQWLERGSERESEFSLGLWEGPYPEEQLPAVVQLFELTNQQPMGDLEMEDMHFTAEQLRQMEKMLFSHGSQRWTYYVIEKANGKFAGYTETVWNPNRPEILRQDMTGIFPEYRNKGLGRWLKAAMLDKVLKERPTVKYVRTGNADTNAAMLKINTELGFRPYMAVALWQLEVESARAYLRKDS
jgi:mycothiol synthase